MRALVLFLTLLAPGTLRAQPSIYGFSFPCWWHDGYESPAAMESFAQLAGTGANSVAIIPTWAMESLQASEISPTQATATDESLRGIITAARARGLKVVLKPHVDPQGGWRAQIAPKDEAAWFASYRAFLMHYARLAAEVKADLFVVGTELSSMSGPEHRAQWLGLIKEVKSVYPGPLTFAANWDAYEKVSFWDQLDYLGVDGYFPLKAGSDLESLKKGWAPHLAALRAFQSRSGKPLLFTEIGIASRRGSQTQPWVYALAADTQLQKDYFQAFLEVFARESFFAGFLQWSWDLDPKAGGPEDFGMTVQGKPALQVLETFFQERRASGLKAAKERVQALLRPFYSGAGW